MKICSINDCDRPSRSNGMCTTHVSRKRRGHPMDAPVVSPGQERPLSVRFWDKFSEHPDTGCWVWSGHVAQNGYGKLRDNGKQVYAHRFSWSLRHGEIESDIVIDHLCYNTRCVNPDHMRACTSAENTQNMDGLRADNTTGHRNVYLHKPSGKWYVSVSAFGRREYGGYFPTIELAAARAEELREQMHRVPRI